MNEPSPHVETDDEARLRRRKAARKLRRLMRFYPPLMGAGIRVLEIDDDFSRAKVRMKLTFWNRNYVGSQYGGSLYSMCDPFYMLILIQQLGPRFIVWDRSASIRFKNPGRSAVFADFHVSAGEVAAIREEAEREGVARPTFQAEIRDAEGVLVAEVTKELHVRPKGGGSSTGSRDER